jgi:hypothetical protein
MATSGEARARQQEAGKQLDSSDKKYDDAVKLIPGARTRGMARGVLNAQRSLDKQVAERERKKLFKKKGNVNKKIPSRN